MSERSRRLRRVRPCYTCGYRARHFPDNGGADGKADPCICRACNTMPRAWRDELRKDYQRRLGDRVSRNQWAKRWGDPIDTTPIEAVDLPGYAWPGGYQMMYYIDGDPVCPKCIMEVLRETYLTGREKLLRDVFYEGPPEMCSHCNEEIESAYGDPDTPTDASDDSEDPDDGGDPDGKESRLLDAATGVDAGHYIISEPAER